MFNRSNLKFQAMFLGLFLLAGGLALAEGGKVEVSGFGGMARLSDGGGTHPIVGGTIGANTGKYLHIFAEGDYANLGSESATQYYQGVAIHASAKAKLTSFGGGVQVRIPTKAAKVEPYVLVAAGYGRFKISGDGSANVGGTAISVSVDESSNHAYSAFGGGARFFVGKKWGVKPEFRYQKFFGDGTGSMAVVTGGIFYQFGGSK